MGCCIYHNADLDGYCSAAIWKMLYPDAALIGMNYGDEVPWDQLRGEVVSMLDFCLQPWSEMDRLLREAKELIWIDHHKSAIESWKEAGCPFIRGSRDMKKAACELTWEYCNPKEPVPRGVFLLGDYDCWRHSDPDTMAYQMGMRLYDMDPGGTDEASVMDRWENVFHYDPDKAVYSHSLPTVFYTDTLRAGQTILTYQNQQNERSVRALWFPLEFEGKRWMAANQGGINSKFWDSVWDDSFDGMLGFVRSGKHWTISLYSKTFDCSVIAKKHGGGGHPGASGFKCEELPFSLPIAIQIAS